MRPLIIYHGGCPDGFTAAWAAWRALGRDADLHAGYYGAPPPDVAGRRVFVVDFSYPRDVLIEMRERAKHLTVYDHHKTAQADLDGIDFCVFDMARSGAGLTWDEMNHGGNGRPWLIDYVEDRDLWRHNLPESRAVNAYVMATPYTLQHWEELADTPLEHVMAGGKAIQRKITAYCCAMSDGNAYETTIGGGQLVLAVNAPQVMISDLLHHLCERQKAERGGDDHVAVGWWVRHDGKYQHSLRSIGAFDVSTIAQAYGGGGHKNAAGFVAGERKW